MKKFISRLIIFSFFTFIIVVGGIFIYVKTAPKIQINTANSLVLYDNTENVFFQGNESKEWVSLDNISEYLIKATIYTEDKNFYKHKGFDFFRILRRTYKTPDFITIIVDIVFWLVSGIILLLGIFILNEGKIRAYLFLGLFLGIIVYTMIFSRGVVKIGTKILKIFNRFIAFPIQKVVKYVGKILKKLLQAFIKRVNKLKIDLKSNKKTQKRRNY